jgi:hypothetical protein
MAWSRRPLIQCSACHQWLRSMQTRLERPGLAEDGPPLWPARAELFLRRERQVDFKPAGQQENPDDPRRGGQVPVMQRAKLLAQPPGPPVRHRAGFAAYRQHQVGVRPAVIVPGRVRAGERCGPVLRSGIEKRWSRGRH